ncbi:TetR/AcrR family transcriptional regulator [Pseudomonas moorei]|nr:TetR/AcrR family transcriptional regulator [Pseudomonas moorei]
MARHQEFDTAEALQKAMGVFWRKGFEATSLMDLLDATGLSKSSLYGTFGSKRELFLNAFDAYREHRLREMFRILRNGSGRQAIETFFRMIVADAESVEFTNGCMSINQAVEMAPHDADIRQRVVNDFGNIGKTLVETIQRGKTDGSIKSNRDAQTLAQFFILGFPGLQVMIRAGCGKTMLEHALNALLSSLDKNE